MPSCLPEVVNGPLRMFLVTAALVLAQLEEGARRSERALLAGLASLRRAISRSSMLDALVELVDGEQRQVLPDLVPASPGGRVLGKGIEGHIVLLFKVRASG